MAGGRIAIDDPRDPDYGRCWNGPFGGYQPSEDNLFMTLELAPADSYGTDGQDAGSSASGCVRR
jgi:hypothetical protein